MAILTRNRLNNTFNQFQGKHKKVLCVCSAGVLRSPTAAHILSAEPFNFNTRAVGTSNEYALIPIDLAHIAWAECIVVMDDSQLETINKMQMELITDHYGTHYMLENKFIPVYNLNIEDDYDYRDPAMVSIMTQKLNTLFSDAIVKKSYCRVNKSDKSECVLHNLQCSYPECCN